MNLRLLIISSTLFTAVALYAQAPAASEPKHSAAVEPTLIFQPKLDYPPMAAEAGLLASVYIKIAIDEKGIPYKTDIAKRDPEYVYQFDAICRKWAMKCRFSPWVNEDGKPEKAWVMFPIRFKISDFEPPQVLEQPVPEFPQEALEMGMEGWVGIAVLVDELGTTLKTNRVLIVAREPSLTTVFDEAAIQVAKHSKFKPATSQGGNTKGWAFLKIEFRLPGKKN